MGAGVFHGRVRDGIGWSLPRHGHQVVRASRRVCDRSGRVGVGARRMPFERGVRMARGHVARGACG
jgi:hypothetical protein